MYGSARFTPLRKLGVPFKSPQQNGKAVQTKHPKGMSRTHMSKAAAAAAQQKKHKKKQDASPRPRAQCPQKKPTVSDRAKRSTEPKCSSTTSLLGECALSCGHADSHAGIIAAPPPSPPCCGAPELLRATSPSNAVPRLSHKFVW